jgi:hypothetical protein
MEEWTSDGTDFAHVLTNKTISIANNEDKDEQSLLVERRTAEPGHSFSVEYTGEDNTKIPSMNPYSTNTIYGFRSGVQFKIKLKSSNKVLFVQELGIDKKEEL